MEGWHIHISVISFNQKDTLTRPTYCILIFMFELSFSAFYSHPTTKIRSFSVSLCVGRRSHFDASLPLPLTCARSASCVTYMYLTTDSSKKQKLVWSDGRRRVRVRVTLVQSGASGCGKGFVKYFLKVPLTYLGSTADAVQPNVLWNSQKHFTKPFSQPDVPHCTNLKFPALAFITVVR